MIYPENFEKKIGFDEIRIQLKGRCISSLGTEKVDEMTFMTKRDDIVEALTQVEEYTRFMQEEDELFEENFFDVRPALMRIRPERTYMEEHDLYDLKRSLETILNFVKFFNTPIDKDAETPQYKYPALHRAACDILTFPDIIRKINTVLDKYGKVKDTASKALAEIRRECETVSRSISHSLRSIISEAQAEGLIERDVTPTMRDGRLVIPVIPAMKRRIKGIIHDESATGKTVFIEPSVVVESNNRIRELKAAEKREIIRILQEITTLIRPHVREMLSGFHFLGIIDFLRAKTLYTEAIGGVIPTLADHPQLDFYQAIHPLLQKSLQRHGEKMVPLDITLNDQQHIIIISGPNAGGKSVCLKTVGLLQYMLQTGMPIPVGERSKAGIFEDIFIDIGDEQSLENDLSTYSSHLLNMKQMMKFGRETSLLLIDEFGGGTEPQIGGALAEAILNEFAKKKMYGVITTHYQNLKHFADATPLLVNAAMLYDRQQMRPLFILQIGSPGSSFAIEIARKIGIPERVIAYASDIVGKDYVMSDKYLLDIVRDKKYWENKRRNIHQREEKLEEIVSRYERDAQALREERKLVMEKAKEQAQNLLKEANARIENTIREIKEAQAEKERTREARQELSAFKDSLNEEQRLAEEEKIARKMAQIQRRRKQKEQRDQARQQAAGQKAVTAPKPAQQPKSDKPLQPGDTVRIKGQTTVGTIESIEGQNAFVLFGMMRTNVKLNRLEAATPPKTESISRVATYLSKETRDSIYEKKLHFKPDIDIRGLRADEALNTLRTFIDDAILLEVPRVRILHGTGTGALRQLTREYLGTVNGVANYHDEHVQFGGAGITVVDLE